MAVFEEIQVVELTGDVRQGDVTVPRGTRGTSIVAGRAQPYVYVVESSTKAAIPLPN